MTVSESLIRRRSQSAVHIVEIRLEFLIVPHEIGLQRVETVVGLLGERLEYVLEFLEHVDDVLAEIPALDARYLDLLELHELHGNVENRLEDQAIAESE